MNLKNPLSLRASAALALLFAFPIKAIAGPSEIKINTPLGEGAKPVVVQTGQTNAAGGMVQTAVPTLGGGVLPVIDAAIVEPGIGAPAFRATPQNSPTALPENASPIDIAAPAGVERDQVRVVPKSAAVTKGKEDAPSLKVGDKKFQQGIRRVEDGTADIGTTLEKKGGGVGNIVQASLVGGRLFDGAGKNTRGNFADNPSGANGRRGPPRRNNLERAGPSDEQFIRAFLAERIPAAEESGKEGVEFNNEAIEKRVTELQLLGRRMEGLLQTRYRLDASEARNLWREILKEHPTAFGYHIPEHSHQPLMVTQQVLNGIESLGAQRSEVKKQNAIELEAAKAAYDEFNTKPVPQKYNGDRTARKLSKAAQIRTVQRELDDAGPAAVHLEWMWEALKDLKFEQLQLNTKLTQAELMQALLDNDVTREDRAILDIATILHDVDPEREEGTLARVAYTLKWLDTARGDELFNRLAAGHFPSASPAELSQIKDKVKAFIMATDFQYEGDKKAAIWPDFQAQVAKAWKLDLKAAWGPAELDEFPADVPESKDNQTVRKVLALSHLLRISDQFGAYTTAASLTPDNAAEGFRFTDWMVRMLKREMRRTPFVPEFLQGLPADGLLAGTFNFLTQREPGSPTFDDKVEGAAKPLSVAGITDQVLNTARNFRSAYAPEKLKPSDFWASPEDAEKFLLSPRSHAPEWFRIGRRPGNAERARIYDDLVSAYIMTRPDGLYRTNREQVISMLDDHGIEIDWEGAPPKELPKTEAPVRKTPTARLDATRAPPRAAVDTKESDIGRALAATKRYISGIAGGIKIDEKQRYALMEMGLQEQGIRLDSEIGRAVEAELFPDRAKRGDAARSAIGAQFVNHADLIIELAQKFGKTTQEVEAIIKADSAITSLLSRKTNAGQARTQLVFALQRDRVTAMTSKFPDNPQGRFLREMGQTILTPGGKSIEEIVRAGAFAYISFRGNSVDTASVGRDPDVMSSDYVFYILLEPDGRWTINGYRKNKDSLRGPDQEYIEVVQKWLKRGQNDQVQFIPRRI